MYLRSRSRKERRAAFALSLVLVAVGVIGVVDRSAGLAHAARTSQDTFASVSFIDARDAWSLIERPCSGRPSCEVVEVTSDGGRSWHRVASLPACHAAVGCSGQTVEAITPLSRRVAIASGSPTAVTSDGGHTWTRLARPLIEAVAPLAGRLFALTYRGGGCPSVCDVALALARAGTTTFLPVRAFRSPSQGFGDSIVGAGRVLYAAGFGHPAGGVRGAYAVLSISRDAGRTWALRGDPCAESGRPEVDSTQIVAAGRYVALLCELRRSGKASIALSADRGRTFSRVHPPVTNGNQIALDAGGDLAIANGVIGGDGPWTYRLAVSSDRGSTWRVALTHTTVVSRGTPPSSIAIFGRSLRWVMDDHTLWTSDDAGRTWRATSAP
jgi:photosystem II stability/assembly factor-like uncharacterized protein